MNNGISNNSNPPVTTTPPVTATPAAAETSTTTPSGRNVTDVTANANAPDVQRHHTTEPPQSTTTPNPRSTTSWWAKWLLRGLAATSAASYTNPYITPAGDNANSDVTSDAGGATSGVTTTHPTDWNSTQRTSLEEAVHNAGGQGTPRPTLSLDEQARQGARPRTTQSPRNEQTQQRHEQRNRRWAQRQETSRNRRESGRQSSAEQSCGSSSDYQQQRRDVAAGNATASDYSDLGGFHHCKGDKYLSTAARMGDPNAAWQRAKELLGSTTGPTMQPSAEALQAMADARQLGSPQATDWVDKFIEYHMQNAEAFRQQGPLNQGQNGGLYTEQSVYYFHMAARAGFGDAQALAARLFARIGQWHFLWEMLERLASNTGFLESAMTSEMRALMRWLCDHLVEFQAGGMHAGVDQQTMIRIIQFLSNYARSHFS